MANGASRLFKIMQNAGTDTISEVVSLTVKSLNPLVFNLDNRIDLTSEFYTLSNDVDRSRLRVGTKVMATTFNGGQNYYITQGNDRDINKSYTLQQQLNELKSTISTMQTTISTQADTISSLETRLTTVEGKI